MLIVENSVKNLKSIMEKYPKLGILTGSNLGYGAEATWYKFSQN